MLTFQVSQIRPTNFVRVMNKTDSLLILMTRNGSFKEQCGTDQIYTVTSYVQRSESSNILTKARRAASSSANLYRSDVAILYNKLCIYMAISWQALSSWKENEKNVNFPIVVC